MPADVETLATEIARLSALIETRRKRRRDPRPMINIRVSSEEMAAIDAAAAARSMTRADLVRVALMPVINREIAINRDVHPNFRKRRKASRFDDGKTDLAAQDQATAREEASRRAVRLALAAKQANREVGAATSAPATMPSEMMSEAAGAREVPRLPGAGTGRSR